MTEGCEIFWKVISDEVLFNKRVQNFYETVNRTFNMEDAEAATVFFCEFCKIFKNTFFTEHLWVTASVSSMLSSEDKTYFDITISFRFSGKLLTHTLARIINESLIINIKLVWWKELCFTFVTRFIRL